MPLFLHQYYPFRLSILCEGHETIERGHWPQLVELVFEQVSACLVAVVSGARWAQTLSSANVQLRCKPINVTFLVFYSLLMPRTGCGSSVSSTLSQSLCQQPVSARQVCVCECLSRPSLHHLSSSSTSLNSRKQARRVAICPAFLPIAVRSRLLIQLR